MQQYETEQIRNIVLLGHSGSGKTTLAEAMLFGTGAISRLGKADDGTSVSDYEPEEIKRNISINLSLIPCEWNKTKLNIIDTPGYPDFVAEVKSGMGVCEGAVIVVCAASGVEVGTEQVWEFSRKADIPSFIFINKMDRENANFNTTCKDIQGKLGKNCLPIQLPIGSQKNFQGIVDLISKKGYTGSPPKEVEVPAELQSEVDSYRENLIETIVEVDDDLISRYLDGQEISNEEIYKCLCEATLQGKVVPILVGTALNNIGISNLMDAMVSYLPSPKTKSILKITDPSGNEQTIEPSSGSPLSALVFKTTSDPYVGKITYFRVCTGTISSNSQVWNIPKGNNERIGQISFLKGKTQESATKVIAGDIGTVTKLVITSTGDTLCTREHPLKIAPIEFPKPVLCVAVHPKSKGDLDKMSTALPKITEEDMTIKIQRESGVGEMLLCGMGDAHLEVASEKLTRKFGVEVNLNIPKVPYKETITVPVNAEYKHKKQTGGHGQYGHVLLSLEPLTRGDGFEFVEKIVGGAIPKNYIPAVEKGVNEARLEGVLAKYPAVDIKVTLYDGSFHSVDSSDMSFKIAGAQAFKKGLSQGQPVLLEPIVNMTITVPDSFTGDIIGDLNGKRARVIGMSPTDGMNVIQAQAPQGEVQRYAIDLRSMTQGRGTFTTKFSHFEEVPAPLAQKIISQKE